MEMSSIKPIAPESVVCCKDVANYYNNNWTSLAASPPKPMDPIQSKAKRLAGFEPLTSRSTCTTSATHRNY